MTFGQAVKNNFSKYVTFSGRAARSEFWWWGLFVMVTNLVLSWVDIALFGTVETGVGRVSGYTDMPVLSSLFLLATLLPSISVTVRRLHDRDKSGWWYWLFLVPIVGSIVLLVWFILEGTRGANSYGPDPLDPSGSGDSGEGLTSSSIPSVGR
ncbi:MAG: DUF805 domain-containing protein [Maritimibacter sp.]|jgi:uncharacterized membrane protein YhaH (DUF805 family)